MMSTNEFDHSLMIDTESVLFPGLLEDIINDNGQSSFETVSVEPSPSVEFEGQKYMEQQQQMSQKMSRRRLTADETRILTRVFERNPKPNAMLRDQLASQLNMSPRNVQVWFQNRRAKARRDGPAPSPVPNQYSMPFSMNMPQHLVFPQQVPILPSHHQTMFQVPMNQIRSHLLPHHAQMFFVNAVPQQMNMTMPPVTAAPVPQHEKADFEEPRPRTSRLDSTASLTGSMESLDMFDTSLLVADEEKDPENDDILTSLDKNINIHQTLAEMNALLPPTSIFDADDDLRHGFDVKRRKTIHHPFDAEDIFDDLEFRPASIQRKYSI